MSRKSNDMEILILIKQYGNSCVAFSQLESEPIVEERRRIREGKLQ